MSIDKLKTKFFTGAWLTDVKHYFTKINEIIDYLNNNPVPTVDYVQFKAYLSSDVSGIYIDKIDGSGSGAALVDTIGGLWSVGAGTGKYYYTKTGMFSDISKIAVSIPSNAYNQYSNVVVNAAIRDDDTLLLEVFSNNSYTTPNTYTPIANSLYIQLVDIIIYN